MSLGGESGGDVVPQPTAPSQSWQQEHGLTQCFYGLVKFDRHRGRRACLLTHLVTLPCQKGHGEPLAGDGCGQVTRAPSDAVARAAENSPSAVAQPPWSTTNTYELSPRDSSFGKLYLHPNTCRTPTGREFAQMPVWCAGYSASAAARPAARPENRQPPRNVPSNALYPCTPPPPNPATSPAAYRPAIGWPSSTERPRVQVGLDAAERLAGQDVQLDPDQRPGRRDRGCGAAPRSGRSGRRCSAAHSGCLVPERLWRTGWPSAGRAPRSAPGSAPASSSGSSVSAFIFATSSSRVSATTKSAPWRLNASTGAGAPLLSNRSLRNAGRSLR